jgi:hypothetical protein
VSFKTSLSLAFNDFFESRFLERHYAHFLCRRRHSYTGVPEHPPPHLGDTLARDLIMRSRPLVGGCRHRGLARGHCGGPLYARKGFPASVVRLRAEDATATGEGSPAGETRTMVVTPRFAALGRNEAAPSELFLRIIPSRTAAVHAHRVILARYQV